MSAYTTIRLTREAAERLVLRRLADKLEALVAVALEDSLYTCRIVSDDDENDNDVVQWY